MAVFTSLDQTDIEELLDSYAVGRLVSFQSISEGIENTNYFVNTQLGEDALRWVLTLFENLDEQELPYFCKLTEHLARQGFKVPAPQKTRVGDSIIEVKGKKAVLVPCLSGQSKTKPSLEDCKRAGEWLARMHMALESFDESRRLVRDLGWMQAQRDKLQGFMPEGELKELEYYIARYKDYQSDLVQCPQGTVHGDLFRDNVLFDGGEISGVIDFYHACDATLLFDLAVVANDWCAGDTGYDKHMMQGLVEAYQSQRPWTDKEEACWQYALELAALRFWVSRLVSKYVPGYQQGSVSGETIKDPDEMKRLLRS